MSVILRAWSRVPVLIRAVLVGLLAAAAASYPWAWLAGMNLRHGRAIPWGAGVMALYLWWYWRYLTGRGWPRGTAAARRERARVRALPGDVWAAAIFAGVLGLGTSIALIRLIGRLVVLPHEQAGDVAGIPLVTLFSMVAMGALVAGVAEELSFRGYMQRPIERRHGPVAAILTVGLVFGFAHGGHAEWALILMPYYLAVAATYGALAWLTDSVLPSLALHAGGDLLGALQLLVAHRSVLGPPPAATHAGAPGVDAAFVVNAVLLAGLAVVAVLAYRGLAAAVRAHAMPAGTGPVAA